MDITPLIPDDYEGPIKRLPCKICKRQFYVTRIDYQQYQPTYCHECSLEKDIEEKQLADEELQARNRAKARAIIEEVQAFLNRPDTEEAAMLRRKVEGKDRAGYKMVSYIPVHTEGGRNWLVYLTKPKPPHGFLGVWDLVVELDDNGNSLIIRDYMKKGVFIPQSS